MAASKRCFPLQPGAFFRFSRIFKLSQSVLHIEFAIFKIVLPAWAGSTILLFSTSHDITKNMQIEFVGISSLLECLLGPLGIALE